MNIRKILWVTGTTLAGIAALTIVKSCKPGMPEGASVVKPFDIRRYMGTWYEIARLDFKHERNLNNVTATYALQPDGTVSVVNRGYNYKTGEYEEATGKAKLAGEKSQGKLKVSFFGPFYSGYNIIALDSGYRYALIAGENLEYLWFLSRETTMPEAVKEQYLSVAREVGYDTSGLIWVKHDENGRVSSPTP